MRTDIYCSVYNAQCTNFVLFSPNVPLVVLTVAALTMQSLPQFIVSSHARGYIFRVHIPIFHEDNYIFHCQISGWIVPLVFAQR